MILVTIGLSLIVFAIIMLIFLGIDEQRAARFQAMKEADKAARSKDYE